MVATFLHNQRCMLRLVGYDVQPHRESPVRFAITAISLVLLYAIMWPELSYVRAHIDDVRRATDGLCPLLFGFSSAARLLTLRVRKRQFYRLIESMEALWQRTRRRPADCQVLQAAFRQENRLSFPYILLTSAVGVMYLAFPMVNAAYQLLSGGNVTWQIPMRSIFAYDIHHSPNYELTYLWFVQCTFLCAFGATGIDTLFYAGTFNLSAHFQIIQRHAQAIRYGRIVGRQWVSADRPDELRDLIHYHREVMKLAEYLTHMYQPILLMHFAVSSVQICVIAYQLTLADQDLKSLVTYTTFMLAIGFQCFVYCHGGTRLETESAAVADALYGSRWYQATVRTQRSVSLCVLRAQKPVIVRSVFFSANLFTFSSIVRTACSYIALLQTISGH